MKRGGRGGYLGQCWLGMYHWFVEPLPHYSLFCVFNYILHLSHFWLYGNNFLTTNLPIFKTLLTRIFLPPISRKTCDPLFTSNSTENATHSMTHPHQQEVPLPPPPRLVNRLSQFTCHPSCNTHLTYTEPRQGESCIDKIHY